MPSEFELPEEIFEIHMPQSSSPTVNFCDALTRKANMLNNRFRGDRRPKYMQNKELKFEDLQMFKRRMTVDVETAFNVIAPKLPTGDLRKKFAAFIN